MELKIQRVLSCQQMWTSYYRVVNSHLALLALSESVEMAMIRSVRKTVSAGRSWLGPGGKYLTQESLHGSHLKAAAAAAAAKSLQSCLTLCDPIDGSPPGSPIPGDSPGKNTGVGCHFLLQCMTVKSQSEVAQSCLTLSDPMDCSLPGSSIHGIFQARVLEWDAIAFSI